MPETAAYSSTTIKNQDVVKIRIPVKAWKNRLTDQI